MQGFVVPISASDRNCSTAGKRTAKRILLVLCAAIMGMVAGALLLALHHDDGLATGAVTLAAAMTGVLFCPPMRRGRNRLELRDEDRPRVPAAGESIIESLRELLLIGRDLTGTRRASGWLMDVESGRKFAWKTREARAEALEISTALERCTSEMAPEWGLAAYSQVGLRMRCLVVDREGRVLQRSHIPGVAALDGRGIHTVLTGVLEFGGRWRGQVTFVDPVLSRGRKAALQGLRQLIQLFEEAHETRQTNLDRIVGKEREEIARDLHDGVAQSLIAAEMDLQLLRREASAEVHSSVEAIARAQDILQREISRVRVQIDELRSESNGQPVKRQLAKMLRDFRVETGIQTQLYCESSFERAEGYRAHAALQIVREALSNIRKHSGATRVTVRLRADRQIYLVVQDNGRGFDFAGRRTLTELEASGTGPRVIQERVRVNGGSMVVESHPNQGVRLEVALPLWMMVNGTGPEWSGSDLSTRMGVQDATAAKQLGAA